MAVVSTDIDRLSVLSEPWLRRFATGGLLALIAVPMSAILLARVPAVTSVLELTGYTFLALACLTKLLYSSTPSWKIEAALALAFSATCIVIANPNLTFTGKKSLFFSIAGLGLFILIGPSLRSAALASLRFYILATTAILATPLSSSLLSITASRLDAFSILGDYRLQGFLVSPNTNGALLAVYLVVEISSLDTKKIRTSLIAKISLLILATLQLLQTGSITAMTAAVMGLICFFVPLMAAKRTIMIASVGYALYPATAVFLDVLNGGTRPLPFDSQFATGRGQIWFRVAELVAQYPLGTPASFVLPGEPENALSAYGGGHAHNLVLQLWLLGGWLGIIVAIASTVFFVVKSWSRPRLMVTVTLIALMSFAEVPMIWLPGSANFLVVAAIVAFSSSNEKRTFLEQNHR